MLIPNRFDSIDDYRYGFHGQEKDDEIKGEGNFLNYTFRMNDPRVGRFFAVDPLATKYPYYSPYQFSGNKLIHCIELEGLEETGYTMASERKYSTVNGAENAAKERKELVAATSGALVKLGFKTC